MDRYARSLGTVLVGGFDANLQQVRAGFAWHYKKYEREQSAENRGGMPGLKLRRDCSDCAVA